MATATYTTTPKVSARVENVRLYRQMTGLHSIPKDRRYWALCASQGTSPSDELPQMVACGLITPEQYVGVDKDKAIIAANQETHPTATWIHGDWSDVIFDTEDFNPGLVYLDTTCVAGRIALDMAALTLQLAPKDSIVLVNVMSSNPYTNKLPMTRNEFCDELAKRVFNFEHWCYHGVPTFTYVSNATKMMTMAFGGYQ